MNLHLTPQQEHLIQEKVKTGKYQSPEDEYEQIRLFVTLYAKSTDKMPR